MGADARTLLHALGKSPLEDVAAEELRLAAEKLGLKARFTRSAIERLKLVPLPALAVMKSGEVVVLARCDERRVLLQRFLDMPDSGRPQIESLESFAAEWSGELLLIASRSSLVGTVAQFDFSWFIPSVVRHRRLLAEVLAISLFLQLFALASPLFFQVVMDKVLVHRGVSTLDVLVTGLVIVVVFESVRTAEVSRP